MLSNIFNYCQPGNFTVFAASIVTLVDNIHFCLLCGQAGRAFAPMIATACSEG